MLFDNSRPRYLPHLEQPTVLKMGLGPLGRNHSWIETDADWRRYHDNKLQQRKLLGARVYRAEPESLAAQRELAAMLLQHLTRQQGELYRLDDSSLTFAPEQLKLSLGGEEPLWDSSLWVADDLVIMQERGQTYHLTAASLCSASDWRLEDKFGQPLAAIHAPVPGLNDALAPSIDRFFTHLKPEHPVMRFNWGVQRGDKLNRRPGEHGTAADSEALFYRAERQTLVRLPRSRAVAFTIRVYLHPLESLPGEALDALFDAILATPAALTSYKAFDKLAPALHAYRTSR